MGVPARFRTESLAQCHRIVGFRVFFALPHDNFCHAGMAKIVTPTVFVELRQKLSACRASLDEKNGAPKRPVH